MTTSAGAWRSIRGAGASKIGGHIRHPFGDGQQDHDNAAEGNVSTAFYAAISLHVARRGAIARLVAFLLRVGNDVPAARGFDDAPAFSCRQ
jgi:hypothetical protein